MLANNLTKIIDNSIQSGKISHCYLLDINNNEYLDDNLLYMINSFLNTNFKNINEITIPNVIIADGIKETDKNLSKSNIIEIFEKSSFSNTNATNKQIIIFKNIEHASNVALNSLLKTIEEPYSNTIFILTTTNQKALLPTIKSRAFIIKININKKTISIDKLIKNNIEENEAKLYIEITDSIQQILQNRHLFNLEKINQFISLFLDSFKNKYLLGMFLATLNKKDTHSEVEFYLKLFQFLCALSWSSNPYNQILNKKIDTLTKKNFKFTDAFTLINEYFAKKNDNTNVFLAIQSLIVQLLECYE